MLFDRAGFIRIIFDSFFYFYAVTLRSNYLNGCNVFGGVGVIGRVRELRRRPWVLAVFNWIVVFFGRVLSTVRGLATDEFFGRIGETWGY